MKGKSRTTKNNTEGNTNTIQHHFYPLCSKLSKMHLGLKGRRSDVATVDGWLIPWVSLQVVRDFFYQPYQPFINPHESFTIVNHWFTCHRHGMTTWWLATYNDNLMGHVVTDFGHVHRLDMTAAPFRWVQNISYQPAADFSSPVDYNLLILILCIRRISYVITWFILIHLLMMEKELTWVHH